MIDPFKFETKYNRSGSLPLKEKSFILLLFVLQKGFQGGEKNYMINQGIKPVESKEFLRIPPNRSLVVKIPCCTRFYTNEYFLYLIVYTRGLRNGTHEDRRLEKGRWLVPES